ncbi:MAG: anti-sigma factor [Ornithinimicrobium sp.]|jgi:anti-sigma-K factor RskA|uniref:anti-sigma factor n=1 Tax=Ornithinimicrobium sp. TaxID=1977084 RepID=UPI003D9ADD7A
MSAEDTKSHVEDLLAAFALDAVDEQERALVEDHLRDCPSCVGELADYADTAAQLSEGLEVAPPPQLRDRLLDEVAQEAAVVRPMRRSGRAARWLAGAAAAGLIAVGGWGIWSLLEEDLTPAQEVVQAADAVEHEATVEGVQVTVVTSQERDGAVLLGAELPELEEGQVYQAWYVRPDGGVDSAGVLADAGTDAQLSGDPQGSTAIALSVEPTGGSQQPTTEPIGAIPLQG